MSPSPKKARIDDYKKSSLSSLLKKVSVPQSDSAASANASSQDGSTESSDTALANGADAAKTGNTDGSKKGTSIIELFHSVPRGRLIPIS
jgi:hypothetical protein